jgi:hypothetical protein
MSNSSKYPSSKPSDALKQALSKTTPEQQQEAIKIVAKLLAARARREALIP